MEFPVFAHGEQWHRSFWVLYSIDTGHQEEGMIITHGTIYRENKTELFFLYFYKKPNSKKKIVSRLDIPQIEAKESLEGGDMYVARKKENWGKKTTNKNEADEKKTRVRKNKGASTLFSRRLPGVEVCQSERKYSTFNRISHLILAPSILWRLFECWKFFLGIVVQTHWACLLLLLAGNYFCCPLKL